MSAGAESELKGQEAAERQEAKSSGSPMSDEFRRNFTIYATFHSAGFMLMVVNKLEQTFARSLVECDVPLDASALFTGSSLCGNRLLVIDQGQKLSSAGQGMECLFKVLAMVFLAVLADVSGRKPVLVIGLLFTGASALSFLVATSSPTWIAFRLFALGQGFQGAFPVELLAGITVNDMSNEPTSDPVVVQQVSGLISMLTMIVVEIVGVCLNSSTSTDFRATWVLVALMNGLIAFAAVKFCRETKPEFKDVDRTQNGVLAGAKDEVLEYVHLLRTNTILRLNLIMFACFATSFTATSIDFSFYIAFHEVSQYEAVKHFSFKLIVAILLFGAVDGVCQKHGSKKGFTMVMYTMFGGSTLLVPLYLWSPWIFMFHQYFQMVFSGMQPFTNTIDTRWFDQRLTAKFLSMKSLVQYIVGIAVNPAYGALFDAHATGYFGRMAPYGLQYAATCVQVCLLMGPLWRIPGGLPDVLDRIDKERSDKAAAAAGSETKADSEKKQD